MENKDFITAEWANKTAKAILGEKVQKQLETCLASIERAVKENEMSTSVSIYADPLTETELRKRGFSVKQEQGIDQRDGAYLFISW